MESTADTISQAHAVLHQPANGIEPVTLSPGMTGPPIDMHRILVNLDAKVTAGFDHERINGWTTNKTLELILIQ